MSQHKAITTGNVAVITGAASGIGLAAAQRFAHLGMHVLLSDNDETALARAERAVLDAANGKQVVVKTQRTDVANFSELESLRDAAYSQFGRVDVLMNNAGTSVGTHSWNDLDRWQHLVNVNMWGVIHGIQAFCQAMIDQTSPSLIINTGSKQGITNPPGNPAYNVSKAAVKAATEHLQHTLRNTPNCQLRAHLLVPGYTYTGLTKSADGTKPEAAWSAGEVVDYMLGAIEEGRFYIICPDNEVSSAEDQRRIVWGAGDVAFGRSPLSRWDQQYADQFAAFKIDS